jgi:hypothetical protein
MLGYIADRKAQDLLGKRFVKYTGNGGGILKPSEANQNAFDALQFQPNTDKLYRPNANEVGEIQATYTSTVGKIYYKIKYAQNTTVISNQYIQDVEDSDLPFRSNRQSIRVGRGIRLLLTNAGKTFSDSSIELFVNAYKAEIDKLNDIFSRFEVVEGSEIIGWYNYTTYESTNPSLGTSCMRYSHCQDYFDIYVNNPEVCKMVILKSEEDGKIKGRALLWQIETPVRTTFMDRIYYNYESDINLFKEYAKRNGWAFRPTNDFNVPDSIIMPNNTHVHGEITTKVKRVSYDYYPYVDTFKYYNTSTGHLTSKEPNDRESYIQLSSTSGYYYYWDYDDSDWNEYE